jgi:hypothetical protein
MTVALGFTGYGAGIVLCYLALTWWWVRIERPATPGEVREICQFAIPCSVFWPLTAGVVLALFVVIKPALIDW